MSPRLLVTASLFSLLAVSPVWADGMIYTTRSEFVSTARDSSFGAFNHRSLGHPARSRISIGVGVGRRIGPANVYVGHQRRFYNDPFYNDPFYSPADDAESAARSRASREKRSLERTAKDMGGILLQAQINRGMTRQRGFSVEAESSLSSVILVPDSARITNAAQVARVRLELVIAGRDGRAEQVLPTTVRELHLLQHDQKKVRDATLGSMIRKAFIEAQGKLRNSNGELSARARTHDGGFVGEWRLPDANTVLGRKGALKRATGKDFHDLPRVDSEFLATMNQALLPCEDAREQGYPQDFQRMSALRLSPIRTVISEVEFVRTSAQRGAQRGLGAVLQGR